ncbi:MAG: hypothetical protein Q3M24_14605 [Candidatus Electrothrix aestuarii]|uniref:Roadblock/LAMTOR2 domain-containing protein n=1 Tax=Candidatus Electrothrix aestuarii TaxID=3062594 RepID=A0AAU8LR99_9BACT
MASRGPLLINAVMKIQEKLCQLAEIDGFVGAAVLTPNGRILQKCDPSDIDIELIAFLANNVLRTAEKASRDMGLGRSHLTFMHTEKALVLARCLNEGHNPLGAEPGKCHIHLILLIDNPNSFGIARIEIGNVVELLAEDFRLSPNSLQELNTSLDNENITSTLDTLLSQNER